MKASKSTWNAVHKPFYFGDLTVYMRINVGQEINIIKQELIGLWKVSVHSKMKVFGCKGLKTYRANK